MKRSRLAKGAATPPFCCALPVLAAVVAASVAASVAAGDVAAAEPRAGRTKAQACATCHGMEGLSPAPNTPHLAGQPEGYLVDQLKAFRSGRRPSEVMTVVARPLTDADIADLAAWYAAQEIVLKSGAR